MMWDVCCADSLVEQLCHWRVELYGILITSALALVVLHQPSILSATNDGLAYWNVTFQHSRDPSRDYRVLDSQLTGGRQHNGRLMSLFARDVELALESPGVRVFARSWSLSFQGDSDSGPYLSHLDFCVISLQSIWLLCNLFYN